jgi:hypothetical protein
VISLLLCGYLWAQDDTNTTLKNRHLQKQLEKEKKYAIEQEFYKGNAYDLKGAEVDERSLDGIPDQPHYNDDFDMNSVYD